MSLIPTIATSLVAIEHIYIFVLETFLWTKPIGRRTFGLSLTFAEQTKALGQNQGVYNGFLAAGLIWAVLHPNDTSAKELKLFFLSCVGVAGIVGGLTAKPKIFFVQGLPAIAALGLAWLF